MFLFYQPLFMQCVEILDQGLEQKRKQKNYCFITCTICPSEHIIHYMKTKNKESVNSFWYRTDDLIQIECINKQRRERPTIMHTCTHTSSRTAWRLDSFQRWYEVMGCWKTWLCNVRNRVPHRWCSIRKELWPRECSNNQSCIQKSITSTELWKQTRHF